MSTSFQAPNPRAALIIASGTFHALLLCTALFLTATISSVYYSLLFFITLMIYMYAFRARLDIDASRVLRPVIGMVLLGIIFSFNNELYDALKDVWYAGKAIVCFLLGYQVAKKITNMNLFFNYFVRVAFITALIHLVKIFADSGGIGLARVSGIGGLPIISAMVLPLILYRKTGFVFHGPPIVKALIVATIAIAFILSFSRTTIGCLFLFIFAGAGFFENFKKFFALLGVSVLLAIFIAPMLPNLDVQDFTFLGKISNSFSEIAFTDGADSRDMVVNWRGFEAYRAYVAFVDASIPQQLFGRGWGATVDLGIVVDMGDDMAYQYLPLLHNGYLHVLTKYGLLGLLLYLLFLWRVTIGSRDHFTKNNNLAYSRLITGLGLVLAYTSLVITGIFNKEVMDSVLIILGLFFGSASLPLNKSSLISRTRQPLHSD